ncbi:Beta-catenin-like protein 1 [Beauveria bassiana]|uniref:Beta-catenin-like protein 1 n=1 Tax=Beauveria bassiana TaxID=176275 RepID=A0A2N6NH39_BEABA|nr:Beta-catenin-like protein 1 [Beauveria bassiana]
MDSVDDVFKNAGLRNQNKRKLDAVRDPNEIYKSSRLSTDGDPYRRARLENYQAEDEDEQDIGPELPPVDDSSEDEEGRFFGGGISEKESQILDYVDDADAGAAPERIDSGWLRKTVLNFEKHIAKNAELRAKFESEPQKFITSEADLDADIKSLSILAEYPELYAEFVRLGCTDSLVGLLAHENTDIAIDAIEIIGELTDEDVAAEDAQWNELVDALLKADLLDLLLSNLSRLNEDNESDRNGVYYSLGILENFCSRSQVAARIGNEEHLLQWLIQRIQRKEVKVTQNKQYSAEVLALVAQASETTKEVLAEADAVDDLLQLVAQYRRRDPARNGEEEEYMENLFEALTCIVDSDAGKSKFLEAEGVELCLIMMKEGKRARAPALRLLDHAASGVCGINTCNQIIAAGGLKTMFTAFMKTAEHRTVDHLVSIFANMLQRFPAESAERIRTLAKFVEKGYEKTTKLVELFCDYKSKVSAAVLQVEANRPQYGNGEEHAYQVLAARLDNGLFTLQLIALILSWLVAEDNGARQRIKKLLAEHDEHLSSLLTLVREQQDGLDTSEKDNKNLSVMLGALIEFLQ